MTYTNKQHVFFMNSSNQHVPTYVKIKCQLPFSKKKNRTCQEIICLCDIISKCIVITLCLWPRKNNTGTILPHAIVIFLLKLCHTNYGFVMQYWNTASCLDILSTERTFDHAFWFGLLTNCAFIFIAVCLNLSICNYRSQDNL